MNTRNFKKLLAGVLAVSMMAGTPVLASEPQMAAVFAEAKAKKPDSTQTTEKTEGKAQEVGKVTCTSAGKLNISFKEDVIYTNALKASIKDLNGTEIPCKISKKKNRLLSVAVEGLVKGQNYTLIIEGVLGKDSAEAVTIEKVFTAKGMKTKSRIGNASVKGKKFVVLKMNGAAYYKDTSVTVKDSAGNDCAAKIIKKSKGTVKIQIAEMKKGEKYTVTIQGIRTKKEKNYGSVTKSVMIK